MAESKAALAPVTGSAREELIARVYQVPWWKRRLLCYLNYSKWQRARSYNLAACDLMDLGDHETADIIRTHADQLWAEIYALPNDKAEARRQ
jgi:hypothetical protein